jgi:hypothetical protein
VNSVVCASAGYCAAVGEYKDTTGSSQALVATQSAGGAWQASELTLPAGATTTANAQDGALNSVVCTSAGNCVAAGDYIDTGTRRQPMVATQSAGGAWQASELTLPANANTTNGVQNSSLYSVACASAGNCVAVGEYKDTTTSEQAMVATQSAGGAWQASELTLPANATTTAGAQSAVLSSVACGSAGNCAAGGLYGDTTGSEQALVATQSAGGVWQASELTLPADSNTTAGQQTAIVNSVVCASAGYCAAVGEYKDTTGSDQALAVSSVASLGVVTSSLPSATDGSTFSAQLSSTGGAGGGTWSVSSGSLPAGLSLDPSTGVISGVPSAVGTSSFTVSLSDPGPPVQHASASLSIAVGASLLGVGTSSLPSGTDGSAYNAGLSSTGGAGGGTWSLSSGSLPAGLSLNPSTGVISGVPRAVGTSSFTVSLSDPGPPVQHASASLLIAVFPAPAARIRLVKTSGSLVTLTLVCAGPAGQTCSGTLKLSALEHLTGHTITAVTAGKPKKTTKIVTLANANYTLTGASRTLKITLNKTGKTLLAKYHKLSAKLTLTPTGARTPATTKTITLRPTQAKHTHH